MGVLYARVGGAWVEIGGGSTGIDQATGDARYVQKTGDNMSGDLSITQAKLVAGRVDIKDPAPFAGWATQRMFHENNTDFMSIDVLATATPGLEISDSRDPNSVLTRIARGERVKFPTNGHEHKHHCCVAIGGATPVTTWTQFNLSTVYETSGTMTIQSSPGGVLLPEAGYYSIAAMIVSDRALASAQQSLKWANLTQAFTAWGSGIPNRFGSATTIYATSANQWVTVEMYTPTPTWLGGQGAEDKLTIVSLF